MSRTVKISKEDVRARLSDIDGWTLRNGKLHKEFGFRGFDEAFAFMTRVAKIAGQLDHHPEWFNVYNKVTIDLMTHDVDGISELDFALAEKIDFAVDE